MPSLTRWYVGHPGNPVGQRRHGRRYDHGGKSDQYTHQQPHEFPHGYSHGFDYGDPYVVAYAHRFGYAFANGY